MKMKKHILLISMMVVGVQSMAEGKQKQSNEIESITIQRTVCFAFCPEYTIEMKKDGITTYTAKRFNADTGIFRKNIGSKKAVAIFNQFKSYRVDTCQEMYEANV